MKLIESLLGRRQFLIAAGIASGCALTCKKIAGYVDPGFQRSVATAGEKSGTADVKTINNKCLHLLSPLKIRSVVLKNRIMHTQSPPHLLQGPENYPSDAYRNHYSNIAKNAAIVTIVEHWGKYPITYLDSKGVHSGTDHHSDNIWQDIPPVHNYVNRMIDDIHCEGALVAGTSSINIGGDGGPGSSGGGGTEQGATGPQTRSSISIKEITTQAKKVEDQGYDVVGMDSNNPEAVHAVRSATNLLIMAKLSVGGLGAGGQEPPMGPMTGMSSKTKKWPYNGSQFDWEFDTNAAGVSNVNQPTEYELQQAVEEAKKLEGLADFLWIRDLRNEHPNSFTQDKDKPFNLYYAEAIKKAGVNIIVCPSAGFHDALQNDEFIAKGLTDMVGMATPLFADPEYVKKVYEGRIEDIVPCLMCHDCHGLSRTAGPWYDTCNVNPKWGTPMYKLMNIPTPAVSKKVAVIGGGPGGMKAALVAAERGHKVTLYEKNDALGGLLQFTDHSKWKWTYKNYKDYLITQVNKTGIEVKLKTTAIPSIIKAKGYDTVLVATGAEPVISKMPGADAGNVFNILTAYSNKKSLGKNVVMIGAGRIGTEAAIGMAKDGHKVTVLTSGKDLIELELIGPHNMMNQIGILEGHANFSCVLEATVKDITKGKVMYTDSKGNEKSVQADSIVIYSGLKPRMDEAIKFEGAADQVLLLGDCTGKNGTIQKTIRNAFFMASQV